jgi:hypothetical protein
MCLSPFWLTVLTHQESEPFIQASKRTPVDLEHWAVSMMERNNRRSHLIPQPTVSETQSGLRNNPNGAHVPAAAPAVADGIPTPLPNPVSIPVALASASSGTSSSAITPTPGTASTPGMFSTPGMGSTPGIGSASSVGSPPAISSIPAINSMPIMGSPPGSIPNVNSMPIMGSPPGISSASSLGPAPPVANQAASAPVLRTPTTATADMDVHMQALSLDHGSPLNRPYPVRTSSQQATAGQQSPANGSVLRAPPTGPLPQIPRNTPF